MSGDSDLTVFRNEVGSALARFRKLKTVHVNIEADRDAARALVQRWFRAVRPALTRAGLDEGLVLKVDTPLQALLRLAGSRSMRANYVTQLGVAHRELKEVEVELEVAHSLGPGPEDAAHSTLERAIIETLERLVPTAALSYTQALRDLIDADRVSFRGTANELRAVLWDVLERLAPDKDVMAAPGYKHEKGRTKPTQKQKARYILKSRSLPESARRVPESTVEALEGHVGALVRANYDRSSISAHLTAAKSEVLQIKTYLDSVLAELLQVHSR